MANVEVYLRMRKRILSAPPHACIYSFPASCSSPGIVESTLLPILKPRDSNEPAHRVGSRPFFFFFLQADNEL